MSRQEEMETIIAYLESMSDDLFKALLVLAEKEGLEVKKLTSIDN